MIKYLLKTSCLPWHLCARTPDTDFASRSLAAHSSRLHISAGVFAHMALFTRYLCSGGFKLHTIQLLREKVA